MMVVDLSSSMDARDMDETDRGINRLDAVKNVFREFVTGTDRTAGRGRLDDLIGIVTFARYADSLCPLTLDHGNLLNILKDLSIVSEEDEDGTALAMAGDGGRALAAEQGQVAGGYSADRWRHERGCDRPVESGRTGQAAGYQGLLHRGWNTGDVTPMPARDLFGRRTLMAQPVEIDERTLKQIADKANGRYFRAVDKLALAEYIDGLFADFNASGCSV